MASAPVNAWLMVGDDASWPTRAELRSQRRRVRPSRHLVWTAAPQTRPGDLLLFYFMAPTKKVAFAARAGCYPFLDPTLHVNANREVDPHQWWLTYTPLVATPDITFKDLNAAAGGNLILRGKPRHYLKPDTIGQLQEQLGDQLTADAELAKVLRVPVGDPDLPPSPGTMSLPAWRHMAGGPMKLENMVEQFVVEPLLRFALSGDPSATWTGQHRIAGAGVPDYVVRRKGEMTSVVEVKTGVVEPFRSSWMSSPSFTQLTRYMDSTGLPGMLVDTDRIFLAHQGAEEPHLILRRPDLDNEGLRLVAAHLLGTAL